MDYIKPKQVVASMIEAGAMKAGLGVLNMLIRGILAGAILACATTLAFTATAQTGIAMFGALLFPVGFAIIILLGLELVTGNFALIPLAVLKGHATAKGMLANYGWVIAGHLIGCAAYGLLYSLTVTKMGTAMDGPLVQPLIAAAEGKTIAYKELGANGLVLAVIKAVLCNWLVTLGTVMAFTSSSTIGKIVAMWLPVMTFFGQGFEHAVVNMFVIPAGMMVGAEVSGADWWLWNQIPVLVGNFLGGVLLTGMMLFWAHHDFGIGRGRAADRVAGRSPSEGPGNGSDAAAARDFASEPAAARDFTGEPAAARSPEEDAGSARPRMETFAADKQSGT